MSCIAQILSYKECLNKVLYSTKDSRHADNTGNLRNVYLLADLIE